MIRRWAIAGIWCWIFVFGIFSWHHPTAADEAWVSKVVSIQGRVFARRHGETDWQPVHLEDTLFAGDQIRVDVNSRAGIVLSNDAVLRLDQNTILVFTQIEQETTFIIKLLKGAAHFFSRRPRSLKIVTPFVNGVVEGTEFYVQVEEKQTRIELFEGRILAHNPYGEVRLVKGQQVTASAGGVPVRHVLVRPRDSVQWAFYYPPVLAVRPNETPPELRPSMALFSQGRIFEAIDTMDRIERSARDASYFAYRAGLLLNVGRVSHARDDIQQALALKPENSAALALQAVIAVVQNRKTNAIEVSRKAVRLDPQSPTAHIALSYALQAEFKLREALQTAHHAVDLAPENGTARARLAELQLSVGQMEQGVRTAQKAAELDPYSAHAHTILGFAFLMRIKTDNARRAFNQAIALDSTAPLPRLGLGLADIHDGHLEQGRSQIEIAVGLDPANALMRSYLGKAYFDEKRGPLDEHQLDIAKTLDPNDPTPWFYDAIRKQTLNRPVEALQDLQKSIELNDNRAVYRSRLMLDEDLAARNTGLGRIFNDLGFQELALRQGWWSLSTDPANFSAHRLLADSYHSRPRYEIARVSELLQSQLLQPLNITPVQPQLSESHLQILEGAGPGSTGLSELNPLFTANDTHLLFSGMAGGNGSVGNELTVSGMYDFFSMSAGKFFYNTDGFRQNNDIEQDICNLFMQVAPLYNLNIQAEFRKRDTDKGDLSFNFDLDAFDPYRREDEKTDTNRLGFNYKPTKKNTFIGSYIQQDTQRDLLYLDTGTEYNDKFKGYLAEGQYLFVMPRLSFILGAGRYEFDNDFDDWALFQTQSNNYYIYSQFNCPQALKWTIGASYNVLDDDIVGEFEEFNPKFGLTWRPFEETSIRMAYAKVLKRNLVADQTIEPTQIEGFNQFYDDFNGTLSTQYGMAIDQKLSENLHLGVEYLNRQLSVPYYLLSGEIDKEDWEENLYSAYGYFTFWRAFALKLEYSYEHFERDILTPLLSTPSEMGTHTAPVSLSYFSDLGYYLRTGATFVNQDITTYIDEKKSDSFSVVDVTVGYRFPERLGNLSLTIHNVFDEQFNYQEINSIRTDQDRLEPTYYPERLLVLKVNLSF